MIDGSILVSLFVKVKKVYNGLTFCLGTFETLNVFPDFHSLKLSCLEHIEEDICTTSLYNNWTNIKNAFKKNICGGIVTVSVKTTMKKKMLF